MMKGALLVLGSMGALWLLAACANEPPAPKQDDRMGIRTGVTVSSHDMSRVVPTRSMPPQ